MKLQSYQHGAFGVDLAKLGDEIMFAICGRGGKPVRGGPIFRIRRNELVSLTLVVRTCFFRDIVAGRKSFEYRLDSAAEPYWRRRLLDKNGNPREFDRLVIINAYRAGAENRIALPWRGFERQRITHPHFGAAAIVVVRERAEAAEAKVSVLKGKLENADLENMPNRREPTRGGYEFYINEEWKALALIANDTDTGSIATLMKTRFDPDDERVRRVKDGDAILDDVSTLRALYEKAEAHAGFSEKKVTALVASVDALLVGITRCLKREIYLEDVAALVMEFRTLASCHPRDEG